jgi:hypothetical protein
MTLLLEHFSTKMDIGGKCKKKKGRRRRRG